MATNYHRTKGVKVPIVLDEDIMELLEAWRCQNYIGKKSRSKAIRGILAIFLGVEGWRGCGTAGYGSAWVQKPGWRMKDPRQMKKPDFLAEVADRLNMDSEGLPQIDQPKITSVDLDTLQARVDGISSLFDEVKAEWNMIQGNPGRQPIKPKLRLV